MLNSHWNLFVEIVDTAARHCRQPPETAENIRMINHLMPLLASLRAEQNGPEKRERERNSFKNCGKSVGRKGMALESAMSAARQPPGTACHSGAVP
jgi:hypothetical protein